MADLGVVTEMAGGSWNENEYVHLFDIAAGPMPALWTIYKELKPGKSTATIGYEGGRAAHGSISAAPELTMTAGPGLQVVERT